MIRFFLNVLAVIVAAYLLPGVYLEGVWSAIVLAIVLGIFNVTLKPLLILFTIPVTVITFGFFLLVINAITILIADYLLNGFQVDGFWWALLFSVVLWITNSFLKDMSGQNKKKGAEAP